MENSANPSGILKRSSSRQSQEIPVDEFLNRKPFKLRFGKQHEVGRSTVSSIKPFGLLPTISPKFYSREMTNLNNDCIQRVDSLKTKIDDLYNKGPQQNLKLPKLESHKYGWYSNVKFSDRDFFDKKYNFGITLSPMVKYRLLILSADKIMETKKPTMAKAKP